MICRFCGKSLPHEYGSTLGLAHLLHCCERISAERQARIDTLESMLVSGVGSVITSYEERIASLQELVDKLNGQNAELRERLTDG